MIKILKHLNKYDIIRFIFVAAFVAVGVYLEILLPERMFIMGGYLNGARAATSSAILREGGIMVAASFGALAAAIGAVILSTQISAGFAARLRAKLFAHITTFSAAEVNKFSPASLITRTTGDVVRVQMIIGLGTRLILHAPTMAIWALVKLAGGRWQFITLIGIAIGILAIMVGILVGLALPRFKKIQKLTDDINMLTRENLSGIRVIRAYNAENYQKEKFEVVNKDITKTNIFVERAWQVLMPGMMLIMMGVNLGLTFIGAHLINAADGNPAMQGTLFLQTMQFSQYAMMVVLSFIMLIIVFALLPRALVSARRIDEVLRTKPSVVDGDGVEPVKDSVGEVEFRNVSFKYPDAKEYILKDISFKAQRGDTVAFIGSTGSGKSTLINLVPRFYDATDGDILINGESIKSYKLDCLNNHIGYISQQGVVFSGDIKDNIAFGQQSKELFDDEIYEAARIAQGLEFIATKHGRLSHSVAQGGTNLSGGQKQRLSIARAIAKKPDILIFDDSFSALDFRTDKALRDALKIHTEGVTSLIVAQRVGTIMDADTIVVLEKGKVVGEGTHSQLLKSCSVYKEIALSQFKEEELITGI